MPNRVLSLLLVLALAVPAVAAPATSFAQSAGDDQYVDPFQDNSGGGGNQDNSGNSGDQGTDTAPQQPAAPTAPADTSATAGTTVSESANAGTLPRTGLPVGGLALMGVILLGGGFTLRRVWPRPH
jgi:hypothetical protein